MKTRHQYRGFHIECDPVPIPILGIDWSWWHDGFDGAPDSNDRRRGLARTLEVAKSMIDELIEAGEEKH